MQTSRSVYGVLTASQIAFTDVQTRLTSKREGIIATHKSYMMSYHPLPNEQSLLVVNVHAINFVSANYFLREMELLRAELNHHNGPLIVAGDFNVWKQTTPPAPVTFLSQRWFAPSLHDRRSPH